MWLQVKEELMRQHEQQEEAQEDFEVDDGDIELEGEEAEEWTGFSEPAQDESADEEPADETLPLEAAGPVASTSKPVKPGKVASGLLDNAEYESTFNGEFTNDHLEFATPKY